LERIGEPSTLLSVLILKINRSFYVQNKTSFTVLSQRFSTMFIIFISSRGKGFQIQEREPIQMGDEK